MMKIAGSSRKDGIMLVGPHYQVNMTYKDGEYTTVLKKLQGTDTMDSMGKVPGIRGLTSLFRSSPLLFLGLGLQLASEGVDTKSKAYPWIILADGLLTGVL